MNEPVAELVLEQMAVGDASSLRVKWLTDTYPPVGTKLYTHPVNPKYDPETGEPLIDGYPLFSGLPHPVKELNDGGEPVKNATYWKRQYNLMATQNDNLKSGLYHANNQINYLESHPVKELTHRIAELENQLGFIASINRAGLGVVTATPMPSEKIEKIWNAIEEQRDDNFHYGWKKCEQYYGFAHPVKELTDEEILKMAADMFHYSEYRLVIDFARAILRKAGEK